VDQQRLAWCHGLYNVLGGLWPLVHMASFQAVTGPKADQWLVRTVGGLMAVNGAAQLAADRSAGSLQQARRIGMGTAVVLGAISLIYGSRGRISKIYLLDAALEGVWIAAWTTTARHP
jgi:hypothetical protein